MIYKQFFFTQNKESVVPDDESVDFRDRYVEAVAVSAVGQVIDVYSRYSPEVRAVFIVAAQFGVNIQHAIVRGTAVIHGGRWAGKRILIAGFDGGNTEFYGGVGIYGPVPGNEIQVGIHGKE